MVYNGKDELGKYTARGLEQNDYEVDLIAVGGDIKKVANRQNPVGKNNCRIDKYIDAKDNYPNTGTVQGKQT